MYSCPPRTRTTGWSGETVSSSLRYGSRCSFSCASCQSLLLTMTSPGRLCFTRAEIAARAAEIEGGGDRATPRARAARGRGAAAGAGGGSDGLAREINVHRSGHGDRPDPRGGAGGGQPSRATGNRLCDREARVDGDDVTVDENCIRRWRLCRRAESERDG